jgi:hypothetical protein
MFKLSTEDYISTAFIIVAGVLVYIKLADNHISVLLWFIAASLKASNIWTKYRTSK